MYDVPDFYLVANPIDRYSIGDRTPGLVDGDDGSRDDLPAARLARRRQGVELAPAPAGDFRPLMRMYQPQPAILGGDYALPAITKVG